MAADLTPLGKLPDGNWLCLGIGGVRLRHARLQKEVVYRNLTDAIVHDGISIFPDDQELRIIVAKFPQWAELAFERSNFLDGLRDLVVCHFIPFPEFTSLFS